MKRTIATGGLLVVGMVAQAGEEAVRAPSVEVSATFVQFERAVVEQEPPLRTEGRLSHRHVLNMWQENKGSLLSSMSLVTQSGVAASVESVREIMYPVDHRAQAFTLLDENREAFQVTMTLPETFETREAGHILNVTPSFDENTDTITLTIAAEIVEFREWINHGELVQSAGMPVHAGIPKPIFVSHNITTTLTVNNGDTTVVGGGVSEDGEWVRYVIVSASTQ